MLRFIQQILLRVQGDTLKLLILAGVLLLAWGTLAPVGTLIWWLQEGAEILGLKNPDQTKKLTPDVNPSSGDTRSAKINCYIVFLPGVGDFSANQLTPGEEFFLDRLEQLHSNCVTVRNVFPYSAANESLGGQRFLSPLWRAVNEADGWLKNADVLIKIRNLWRFAISADERYGSVYNQGIATAVVDRMNAAYPISRSQPPLKLILIGTSGGAQVSLGAVSYLENWLNAKLIVVSVGGSFDGNTGFETVDHVYHLQGDRDWVEDVARFLFASRWPITVASPFNQARQQGRYTVVSSGPHAHDGPEGYFGTAPVEGKKTSYVELTVQKVNQLPIWSEN
ncbi:hypothetical protein F7734_19610 [Scytonema sp. UIC 10036]|uniref:hypothetical protein n=1 Tax=Scytonema sp. UIC 10036 TaxID=2304196 RepID=UPI0012DA8912|nr:hypothetical protein [Scytonema sp. UIC 10036]MUG94463.1 hypothetical protein [Scytonema sp. UIC 10036]